jgi:hypothetical protein
MVETSHSSAQTKVKENYYADYIICCVYITSKSQHGCTINTQTKLHVVVWLLSPSIPIFLKKILL